MTTLTRHRLIGIAIAVFVFIADQWMKRFVVRDLGLDQVGDQYELLPFFDFTRTNNYGVSLGMFEATSMEMRWILVAVTAAIACVVLVWMLRERLLGDIFALGLVLGGALGNIRDRYLFGYVIDYADFHIGDFRPFLIFNIADAAITIGVVIILARALFMREKPKNEQDAAS
ncbi:signal peptidase II [Aurantiacibacter aquimixticola]|uniref:Lipoprotein signal peptidase n=1 Tax=Aurantiacibacter aquimixticola TaxID=1958945 RepID=A0A419RV19_9SPHN|nr:signal peptidase II [Aurantiacibacter aquimixticola]RJY09631.1 signal peptidase II [Aurantiacibacter aquimixticola]